MTISPGSRLGTYEVLELLGAGGMGQVYRARDTRLGRHVAVKVLPAERVADEARRRRFIQEARAASALNHPNIVTIYEIESADGVDFIVMELVSGKTLDALIRPGRSLNQMLGIAICIADALACAHAAGIVHRDLKPTNVLIGDNGAVKVLDFGLAKLVAQEDSDPDAATLSSLGKDEPLSQPGLIAGTPGYMSPEQATGGKVDSRSDIFAFGTLLYEMVTGRRPFSASSREGTLAAVVQAQPPAPREVVPEIPPELERLILRCLRKDPERRFQHMLDVKVDLQEIKDETQSGATVSAAPVRRRGRAWPAAALAAAVVVAGIGWRLWRPPRPEAPAPRLVRLTSMGGVELFPSFAPDGEQLAFAWGGEKSDNWDVYIKRVDSPEVRRLTTDPQPEGVPSWSPDGRQIAFLRRAFDAGPEYADGAAYIHLISPLGGPARRVGDFPSALSEQVSWSPDGRWLAAVRARSTAEPDRNGIYLVPVKGGEPRRLGLPKADFGFLVPRFSPDGRHLAYLSWPGLGACALDVVELGAEDVRGAPRRLVEPSIQMETALTWTRDGKWLVYAFAGTLWRVGTAGDRPPERIELAGFHASFPAAAANRDRLAFARGVDETDIYRTVDGGPSEPFVTSSQALDFDPNFSPDGRRVALSSARAGERNEIWVVDADGSNAVQVTHGIGQLQGSPRWSPDGRRLAFDSQGADGHWDIWLVDVDGLTPRRLTQDPGDENTPAWSRDGRFLYFGATRQGHPDVWRIPSEGGTAEQVTRDGGCYAQESLDGRSLYYKTKWEDSPLLVRAVGGGAARQALACVPGGHGYTIGAAGLYHVGCLAPNGPPTLLAPTLPVYLLDPVTGKDRQVGTLEQHAPGMGFDVSPDGRTFLYAKSWVTAVDLWMIEDFR